MCEEKCNYYGQKTLLTSINIQGEVEGGTGEDGEVEGESGEDGEVEGETGEEGRWREGQVKKGEVEGEEGRGEGRER